MAKRHGEPKLYNPRLGEWEDSVSTQAAADGAPVRVDDPGETGQFTGTFTDGTPGHGNITIRGDCWVLFGPPSVSEPTLRAAMVYSWRSWASFLVTMHCWPGETALADEDLSLMDEQRVERFARQIASRERIGRIFFAYAPPGGFEKSSERVTLATAARVSQLLLAIDDSIRARSKNPPALLLAQPTVAHELVVPTEIAGAEPSFVSGQELVDWANGTMLAAKRFRAK